MLNTDNPDRQKSQNQEKLSISNRAAHDKQYPFLSEFSGLIAGLSTGDLTELLTHQQKMFAKAIWEAENYGGSVEKCKKRLKEIHGSKWYQIVDLKDHMAPIREYQEYVLRLDHKQQWNKHKNSAKLSVISDLE